MWSCFSAFVYKTGPGVAVVSNAILLLLAFSFKLFRIKTKHTKYIEYIMLLLLAVHTILCTLTNTSNLPDVLLGSGID